MLNEPIDYDALSSDELMKLLNESEARCLEIRDEVATRLCTVEDFINYKNTLIKANGISVSMDDNGVITIQMPLIMPFKKLKSIRSFPAFVTESQNAKFNFKETLEKANIIIDGLSYALDEFIKNTHINSADYKNAIYEYINYYNNYRGIPDTDNFEYKQITDVIANHLTCGNDNGIDFVLRSRTGKRTFTELKTYPNHYALNIKNPLQT